MESKMENNKEFRFRDTHGADLTYAQAEVDSLLDSEDGWAIMKETRTHYQMAQTKVNPIVLALLIITTFWLFFTPAFLYVCINLHFLKIPKK